MYLLTEHEEWLCKEIADCAFRVHKELGPGLLEKIYEVCLCHELEKKGIPFERQVKRKVSKSVSQKVSKIVRNLECSYSLEQTHYPLTY